MSKLIHRTNEETTVEWGTPWWLVHELMHEYNGGQAFDLDPAAKESNKKAKWCHSLATGRDGLIEPWFGSVFINPPYGRGKITINWARKMLAEHHARRCQLIVAVVQSKTDTLAWHECHLKHAAKIDFFQGRLMYDPCEGQPTSQTQFASAAVIYWAGHSGPPIIGTRSAKPPEKRKT